MRRFSPSLGSTNQQDIESGINQLNQPPAVRLPSTFTIRVVPDKPSVLPKFGFGQPQFIQTMSDDGGDFKSALNRSMEAQNQVHWNIQREMNFQDTFVQESKDRTERAQSRIWYKGE
jgi:hypothetical protein